MQLHCPLATEQDFTGSGDEGVDTVGAVCLSASTRLLNSELSTVMTAFTVLVSSHNSSQSEGLSSPPLYRKLRLGGVKSPARGHSAGKLPSWDSCPCPPTCLSSACSWPPGGVSCAVGCLSPRRLTAPSCFMPRTSWDSSRLCDATYAGDSISLSLRGPPPCPGPLPSGIQKEPT